MIMSGYGTCPGCREITKLTVHHDKNLKIKVLPGNDLDSTDKIKGKPWCTKLCANDINIEK